MSPERRAPRTTAVLHSVREIQGRPRPWLAALGYVLIVALAVVDAVTDWRFSFAALYLAPLALVAWFGGRRAALAGAGLAVAGWMVAHGEAGPTSMGLAAMAWNAFVRLAGYIVFAYILVYLRGTLQALADALEREHELARVDPLTGVRNARAFRDAAEQEVARSARYRRPLTLAYLDADGFKAVNDRLGHATGDRVLRVIAQTLQTHVRAVDTVARLGGDEFAVLFPETDDAGAQAALRKLRTALVGAMAREEVDVTFCIGAVTSLAAARNLDALLQRADALMYEVKQAGKDGIRTATLEAPAAPASSAPPAAPGRPSVTGAR